MSRVGKLPVPIPDGVTCEWKNHWLKVSGPNGVLARALPRDITVHVDEKEIVCTRPSDKREHRSLHGLTRTLVYNMVVGVTQGYEKTLLIEGIGYRVSIQGKNLNLALGFSHPVSVEPPEGITFSVSGQQTVKVSGIDKELVGQVAANIRALRKPEPYKGKGIRYEGERIRRKVSKATTS